MSIVVSCSCGQKLAATPEMMGRMISCPQCGRALTVGASAGAGAAGSSIGSSKLLVFLGIGGGAVITVGILALVAYLAMGSRTPAVPAPATTAAPTPSANSSPSAAGPPGQIVPGAPGAAASPVAPAAPGAIPPPSTPPAAPSRSLVDVEPDLRMNAKVLALEWEAGQAAADAKYGGKVIEVDGSVKEYGTNFENGQPDGGFVQIGDMEVLFKDVRCKIAETDLGKKIAKKSSVKIKGLWKSTPPGARASSFDKCTLESCVFTEVGPNPRLVTTAEEMSILARADRQQFRARYYDYFTEVSVTAEVESVVRGAKTTNNVCIVLKTSAAPRILFEMLGNPEKMEDLAKTSFPPGTKVKITGIYNDVTSDNNPDIMLNGSIAKDE